MRTFRVMFAIIFWICLFQFVSDASRIAEAGMLATIFLYLTTLEMDTK